MAITSTDIIHMATGRMTADERNRFADFALGWMIGYLPVAEAVQMVNAFEAEMSREKGAPA